MIWKRVIKAANTAKNSHGNGCAKCPAHAASQQPMPAYIGLRLKRYTPSETKCSVCSGLNGLTVVRTRRNAHTPNTPNAVPNAIKTTDSNIGKRGSMPASADTCAEAYISKAQIKHIAGGGILVSKFILLSL